MPFPTTSLIDAFDRADENPVAAPWGGAPTRTVANQDNIRILSNQLARGAGAQSGGGGWYATSYAADQEAWLTVATMSAAGSAGLNARIVSPNTGAVDYYEWAYTVGTGWRMFKVVDNVYTQIGSTVTTPALASGDGTGFELIGSTLRGLHRVSGVWSQIMFVTDTTLTAGGFIGAVMTDAAARCDDFGGGVVVVAPTSLRSQYLDFDYSR